MVRPLVIIESPYRADGFEERAAFRRYALQALRDSLFRGESPFASHLLYTQVLDDGAEADRELGISAGLEVARRATKTIVYQDYGISEGMNRGIMHANACARPVIYRRLHNHGKGCAVWTTGKRCDCGAI